MEVSIGWSKRVTRQLKRTGQGKMRGVEIDRKRREGKGRLGGDFNCDEPSILMTPFLLSMGE